MLSDTLNWSIIKRKPPKSLKQLCFEALPSLITAHICKVVDQLGVTEQFPNQRGGSDTNREEVLNEQVSRLRHFIYSQVICYDYEKMFAILLLAVDAAVLVVRAKFDVNTMDITAYHLDVESRSKFSEIVSCPEMKRLDFHLVPKSLRSRIIEILGDFTYLKVLVLGGSSGGQWPLKHIVERLTKSLEQLYHLEEFSMKHDCSPQILEVVTRTCSKSLIKLDVECSVHVDDCCLPYILRCTHIIELSLFKTGLTDESFARIIMGLPNLVNLPRGDFLCHALGWIDYLEELKNPVFLIKEFFPSQMYYFHEEWQVELVSRMCPFISKMLFIFHETCVQDYTIMLPFEHLREIEFYGGAFYSDKISQVIDVQGKQLIKINLISVKEVDFHAIALLSVKCPNLEVLSFNHCEMNEFQQEGNPNTDQEYDRRQAFLTMARLAFELMTKFDKLETLSVLSNCSNIHLRLLLSHCPRIKQIHLGCQTMVDDYLMSQVMSLNPMSRLTEFHCDRSKYLTMDTLNLLINQCDELHAVSDLQNWSGIQSVEVGHLREVTHYQNFDLDLRSHQTVRKFAEMRDFEKKTYLNMVSGPTMERRRMAERDGVAY